MIMQSCIKDYRKIHKISDKIIKFITEAIENWQVELIVGRKTLAEVKIKRCLNQRDALLPLLFVIAMMSLNYILWECNRRYTFTKSPEKIKYLMYIDGNKQLAKIEKELEILIKTIRIYSQDKEMEFCIENYAMLIMNGEKNNNGRNWTAKSGKNRNVWRKGKWHVLVYFHICSFSY